MTSSVDLEAKNTTLIGVFVVSCIALLTCSLTGFTTPLGERFSKLKTSDGMLMAVMPILAIITSRIITRERKARMIYWKGEHSLPGCRVFADLGTQPFDDHRLVNKKLQVAQLITGVTPPAAGFTSDRERDEWYRKTTTQLDADKQNGEWYKQYRKYSDRPRVEEMQKQYLLLSDLFVLSLAFSILGVLVLAAGGAGWHAFDWAQVVYLATMVVVAGGAWRAAANAGTAFVLNVLVEAVYDP